MTDDEVAASYAAGRKIREIAEAAGTSYWQVREALKRQGVAFRGRGREIDTAAVLAHGSTEDTRLARKYERLLRWLQPG